MRQIFAFLLVFALSSLPATTIVCDLVLCAVPEAAAATGCHDHGTPAEGEAVGAPPAGCVHLADTAPFVAASVRQAVAQAPVAAVEALRHAPSFNGAVPHDLHGRGAPASAGRSRAPLVLRI